MNKAYDAPAKSHRVGQVTAAAILAWIAYVLLGGLETIAREFVVLGGMRIILLGTLLSFAMTVPMKGKVLGRVGLAVAALGAGLYLVAGIGAVATDGWTFDAFADESYLPWYLIVLGGSASLFALGTILVGIAGRSGGWLAGAVILGGVLYPMLLFPLQPFGHVVGHIVWLGAWLALAVGLTRIPVRDQDRAPGPALS